MFHAEYVRSLTETLDHLCGNLGLRVKLLNRYSSFVPTARELTAADRDTHDYSSNEVGSGDFTYEKIFWIDSDIEWTVDDFMKLLNSEHDVVSGLYAIDQTGKVAAHYPNEHGVPTSINKVELLLRDEPIEVGGVGFGFVRMKQGVFESIPRPWFLIGKVQWQGTEMRVNVGEDYSWCGNAQRAGYKIWVDPTVKVRHHKETVYEV